MESDAAGGGGGGNGGDDGAAANRALQSVVNAYVSVGPDPTNADIHPSIGITHEVKAHVEGLLVAPTEASIIGRLAANITLDRDLAAGDYAGSVISTQVLPASVANSGAAAATPTIEMVPYLGTSPLSRHAVRTNLSPLNTISSTSDLLMEVFVTLSDVRGLLLVPAPDRIVSEGSAPENLRSMGPPSEATTELILARSIQFVPTSSDWWATITPLTHWGPHVHHLAIWALPQSLSLDPYPVGFIDNPMDVERQQNRTIRIKFDHISDCAWEQATYIVVETEGRQYYAPLLQLTSQIQLAYVSESYGHAQLDPYFGSRTSTMSVALFVRRLVWFISLGLDVHRPNAEELILSNEWIAQPANVDVVHQWRRYKCSVVSQRNDSDLQEWIDNPSRYLYFNKAPSREVNTWNATLAAVVPPFQLNLVVYSQVFFNPTFADESSLFSQPKFFHSKLRRAMSRLCLWSDAATTVAMVSMAASVASYVTQVDAVDLSNAGAPPYAAAAAAAVTTPSFSEQCIQLQKRYLAHFLGSLNQDKLIFRTQRDAVTGAGLPVTYDSRFANDWSTLYTSIYPPVISPLINRRQTHAQLPAARVASSVPDRKAYSAAYDNQQAMLGAQRYVTVGGASPTRPSIPAPERHSNPRTRLLNTYVRHLWFRRRADYFDDAHDEDSATRKWHSFMEMINREIPQLRALHLLAIGMPEDRFFEMVQDALLQATPLPRVKTENTAASMLDRYDAADSYKRLLRWLVKSTPDKADDPPLAPLDEAEWLRVLNKSTAVYDKTKLEYDRPKLPMMIVPTEPLLLRRHATLDEATSVYVQTPTNPTLEEGETARSLNRDPNKQLTISSGLNRVKIITKNHLAVSMGYDIPSMGLAMEDALIHKKVENSHFWQDDPKFKVEKSALSWAGQNRLTELALIKYRRMYVDGTIDEELPWEWNPGLNRATVHGFRRFLAHHYLPSSVLIDAAMLQGDENAQVDYMNTTLIQLAQASLVYGSFRAPNVMQTLLQDTTVLAMMWFQSAEEARRFSSVALGSNQLVTTRIATVGNDPAKDPLALLGYCGRDNVLARVDDGTLAPLLTFCSDRVDDFLVDNPQRQQNNREALKEAMKRGLLMDMMAGASLDSIHAMHMLECITFRHEPYTPAIKTAARRAAECAWIGFDAPLVAEGDANNSGGMMEVDAQPLEEGELLPPVPLTNKKKKKKNKVAPKKHKRDEREGDIAAMDVDADNDDYGLPLDDVPVVASPAKRQRTSNVMDDPAMAMVPPPPESFMALHAAAAGLLSLAPSAPSARRSLDFERMEHNTAFSLDLNNYNNYDYDDSPLLLTASATVPHPRNPKRWRSRMDSPSLSSSSDGSVADIADAPRFLNLPATIEELMAYNSAASKKTRK